MLSLVAPARDLLLSFCNGLKLKCDERLAHRERGTEGVRLANHLNSFIKLTSMGSGSDKLDFG